MEETAVMKAIPYLIESAHRKMWIDYDIEADVLYISFVYPPKAVEHEEEESGVVKNYDANGNLVGLTIIGAKRFKTQ